MQHATEITFICSLSSRDGMTLHCEINKPQAEYSVRRRQVRLIDHQLRLIDQQSSLIDQTHRQWMLGLILYSICISVRVNKETCCLSAARLKSCSGSAQMHHPRHQNLLLQQALHCCSAHPGQMHAVSSTLPKVRARHLQ